MNAHRLVLPINLFSDGSTQKEVKEREKETCRTCNVLSFKFSFGISIHLLVNPPQNDVPFHFRIIKCKHFNVFECGFMFCVFRSEASTNVKVESCYMSHVVGSTFIVHQYASRLNLKLSVLNSCTILTVWKTQKSSSIWCCAI